MERFPTDNLDFGGPAVYRIAVQGSLSERMASYFEGMEITVVHGTDHPDQTTLTGTIRDQAALSGLLDTLYGLHLPIIRVEVVPDGGDPSHKSNDG